MKCLTLYLYVVYGSLTELELKDPLKSTIFQTVHNLLLQLYYFYQKSEKVHELEEISNLIENTFKFWGQCIKRIRASGTWWLAYKISAMEYVFIKFGVSN